MAAAAAAAQTGPYGPALPGVGTPGAFPASSPAAAALATGRVRSPSPWSAGIRVQETVTNNVNLVGSGQAEAALVTEVTPTFGVNLVGNRSSLVGHIELPVAIYLPSGVASDRIYPSANLRGDVTLVENFLFLEGVVDVTQQFYNPFGAQPVGVTNPTQNRYRSSVYRVSPIISSSTSAGTVYELRNDNVWTNLNGAPVSTNNAHYTRFIGHATNTTTTVGWRASFDYNETKFNNQQSPNVTQVYRGSAIWNATPVLQLTATAGWESNRFSLTSSNDFIYGAGFVWRPQQLMTVTGDYEHRYFGASYRFTFDRTTPLTQWRLNVSRNVTTYPQQIASLGAGIDVSTFLNALFAPVVSDPALRQQLVDQLIEDRGLPVTTSGPVNLYTDQTLLQENVSARVGLLGARNTVYLSGYYLRSEPITATGTPLPPILSFGNDNTQTGGSLVWSHTLLAQVNLVAQLLGSQTESNAAPHARTRRGMVRVAVGTPVTPRTALFGGVRYQTQTSNVAQEYNEAAAFVGISHTFR
jgi:uncharacterized protein (PEP-CTERM system associated)